ncbi:hypothetical protein LTS18_008633 [Coniosporium uncinatum]|uniref:Uncharacterized protein n=1 Tax=Coniosporium uncinatum TaxID=93489 RepID=A0ACC3D1A8_9PEZI|nr:hypothetical protein LTS18_008633 [Coniosporium uncinatum]
MRPRSLLSLPPTLRTIIYGQRIRSFHATSARRFSANDALDGLMTLPHSMLTNIHDATGLSWLYVLPISALLIRALIIFPMFSIPARRVSQRRLDITPLVSAWTRSISNRMRSDMASGKEKASKVRAQIFWETRKKKKELAVRHRCTNIRQFIVLGQIPIFLTMAECIRLMSGARQSILGTAANAMSPKAGEAVDARFDKVVDGTVAAKRELWFEPSMTTDGALWIPDLTMADPHYILPAAVSALMFTSIYNQSKPPTSATADDKKDLKQEKATGRTALRSVLLGVSLLVFPLTLEFPAAVMVYWFGSTASAIVFNQIIDRQLPLKAPPRMCKRPLPVKRKPWDEKDQGLDLS